MEATIKDRIKAYFEEQKEAMLADIIDIVAMRGVKGEPEPGMPFGRELAQVVEHTEQLAHRLGLSTKNFDNYVLTVNLNDKPTELGIFAHLDVVHEGTGWTTPPYEPDIRDGKIFGRGVADDKGPAVAALYALKAVKDLGIELSKNVRVILGTDEESGSGDLPYYFERECPPPYSFSPDAAYPVYNIEKGRFQGTFTSQYKDNGALPRVVRIEGGHTMNIVAQKAEALIEGMAVEEIERICREMAADMKVELTVVQEGDFVRLTVTGASAHACDPAAGNNANTAILAMLAALPLAESEGKQRICSLARLFPHGDYFGKALGIQMEDKVSGPLTCSFDILRYDAAQLSGSIDCRCPVCSNEENTSEVADRWLSECDLHLETTKMVAPHYVPEDLPFIQTLLRAYEEYTGMKGECWAMGGGTYVHGIENAVAFGACYPYTDVRGHAADEFAVIEELMVSAQLFTQIIIDMCR